MDQEKIPVSRASNKGLEQSPLSALDPEVLEEYRGYFRRRAASPGNWLIIADGLREASRLVWRNLELQKEGRPNIEVLRQGTPNLFLGAIALAVA